MTKILFVRHGQSVQNSAYLTGETYDKNNISLTELGKKQASTTGKYLKMYGKCDAIICSPLLRAIETANVIKKEVGFKKNVIIDFRLEEHDDGILKGLSPDDTKTFINKNKKLMKLFEEEKNETNLFKKYKITEALQKEYFRYIQSTLSISKQVKNTEKFLKFIKTQNYKNIICVAHGGTLDAIASIINNVSVYNMDIKIVLKCQTVNATKPEPSVQNGNCDIMGLLLENNKYTLVIPRNNLHLK